MLVYELSGSGFESSFSHLTFRFRACFEQRVPWHSGNYRVWIHSERLRDMTRTKSHNNYFSVGVMELCLLNLLILTDCFLCNSYPCVLFESLSCHLVSRGIFQNFKKVNTVNLSQISLLNMWLVVLISFSCEISMSMLINFYFYS